MHKMVFVLIFALLGAVGFGARSDFPGYYHVAENIGSAQANQPYLSNCARCHGTGGTGNTELGAKLEVPNLLLRGKQMSIDHIIRVVTLGKHDMPAFGKKLSRNQIAKLAAYVKRLSRSRSH